MKPQAERGPRAAATLLALVIAAMHAAGCAGAGAGPKGAARGSEASLHPPGGATASFGMERGPDLRGLVAGRVHPGVAVPARMQFIEAIDTCGRSADRSIEADAAELRKLFEETEDGATFLAKVAERFTAWEAVPSAPTDRVEAGLITGYATPVVRAKRRRDVFYRYPLFVDLRRRFPEVAESPRREILATPGVETQAIAWVADPLAWALVETNGSGRLVFDDGIDPPELRISRIATNGRPWTGMGRWFAEHGLIDKPNFTLAEVRTTAYAHPEKAEMAALANERVVFFEICDPRRFPTTVGLPGGRLIGGWSCAADQSVYPAGSILLVVEKADGRDVAHLLFVHDSGGAIAGPQRIDCYLGEGDAALARAGELRGSARVYRLRANEPGAERPE